MQGGAWLEMVVIHCLIGPKTQSSFCTNPYPVPLSCMILFVWPKRVDFNEVLGVTVSILIASSG